MSRICGIDEAGRGPLAGPVTAGAAILPEAFDTSILADSKSLSDRRKAAAASHIMMHATSWGIGWAWPEEIDALNIHNASLLAMQRAFAQITSPVDLAYVDGKFAPALPCPTETVVKGDTLIHEIMAASILAKVSRDRWMIRHSWIEPEYGFERHKGYPTLAHRLICSERGPSSIQRHSFVLRIPEPPRRSARC
jgi:ribonuclease HII